MGEVRVLVHPDDVNVADAKALAAGYNTTVEPNEYVPRGSFYVIGAGVKTRPSDG